jgi:hypothetical protein
MKMTTLALVGALLVAAPSAHAATQVPFPTKQGARRNMRELRGMSIGGLGLFRDRALFDKTPGLKEAVVKLRDYLVDAPLLYKGGSGRKQMVLVLGQEVVITKDGRLALDPAIGTFSSYAPYRIRTEDARKIDPAKLIEKIFELEKRIDAKEELKQGELKQVGAWHTFPNLFRP